MSSTQIILADSAKLLIITNSERGLYHLFINQLKYQLTEHENSYIQLHVVNIDDWQPETSKTYGLTLALGSKAAIKLSQQPPQGPVLFSLLPSATYQELIASQEYCKATQCSAIYIDQPYSRTLTLTRLALPQLNTIGLLTGNSAKINLTSLELLSNRQNITLIHKQLDNKNNLVFRLSEILRASDALLSLPDPTIYSSRTAQNILLTAYRHHKPVIGYSRAFVKAGALFGVYSTPVQIAQQTAEVIKQFFASQSTLLPKAQHPKYFSVSVNTRVAKSLGIEIEDQATLQQRLEAAAYE